MTDKPKAHREFWIAPEHDTLWITQDESKLDIRNTDRQGAKSYKDSFIHVIEASALREAEMKIEGLKRVLKSAEEFIDALEDDIEKLAVSLQENVCSQCWAKMERGEK